MARGKDYYITPGCSIHTSLYANRGDFDGRSSLDV